jgi:Uma2 family endonuclease
MSAMRRTKFTPEQYLVFERSSEERHEYIDGEIFDMVGATRNHNLIVHNLSGLFFAQLGERPCQTYTNDMRVKAARGRLYAYPDVVVVCDEPEFEDEAETTLLNPTVIFEVLSPSTEGYDRGKKFLYYQQIQSLRDYLLVSQDRPRVEHFSRQADNQWQYSTFSQADAALIIHSIQATLPITDIYKKVTLPDISDDEV